VQLVAEGTSAPPPLLVETGVAGIYSGLVAIAVGLLTRWHW
jgi:hypothetical protein